MRGEVAIEVVAAGLNFIDVTKVMGIYPGLDPADPIQLGIECAGRITSVGDGVTAFRPGDEVIAITPSMRTTALMGSFCPSARRDGLSEARQAEL